jgi:hypothetical protein
MGLGSMAPMVLQLGSGDGLSGMGLGMGMAPPLGLNQHQGLEGNRGETKLGGRENVLRETLRIRVKM